MGAYEEDPGVEFDVVEIFRVNSLVEPYQLAMEGHIWVRYLPSCPDEVETVFDCGFIGEDHITEDHSS